MARSRTKTETPAALKLKTCNKQIRDGSKRVACGKQYLGDEKNCPNHSIHISKIKTGFCNIGSCEGTKPRSRTGKPLKTCTFIFTCACECHDQLAKLFEMTGNQRVPVDSSGYVPDFGDFVIPDFVTDEILSSDVPPDGPRTTEDGPTPHAAPVAARSYDPTPTGRAARGQLEYWVLKQCKIWTVEGFDFHCTPVWISKNIAHDEAITEPSVGAINAVFERWIKLGFAIIEKKPTRFTGFTDDGARLGLDRMKANAKRAEQMRRAALKRGSLR